MRYTELLTLAKQAGITAMVFGEGRFLCRWDDAPLTGTFTCNELTLRDILKFAK